MGKLDSLAHSLSYDSVQMIKIKDWKLGLLNLTIQAVIFIYIVVSLIIDKGYQNTCAALGTTDIKVKGMAWTGDWAKRVYDAVDLVQPPEELETVFVVTNMWVTRNQTRGNCTSSELPVCNADISCEPNLVLANYGIQTGDCIGYNGVQQNGTCEVSSWCPLELEPVETQDYGLHGVGNFTIFVRSNVEYPEYDIKLDNTGTSDSVTVGQNLWSIEKLMTDSGYDYESVKLKGAAVALAFDWTCNFDLAVDKCEPKIQIYRLDDPQSKLSSGYNYRREIYFSDGDSEPGTYTRDLFKYYGVRVVVFMSGYGGRFDIVSTFTNIGAGIGLLSISSLVADFVATHFCGAKRTEQYKKEKFRTVEGNRKTDHSDDEQEEDEQKTTPRYESTDGHSYAQMSDEV